MALGQEWRGRALRVGGAFEGPQLFEGGGATLDYLAKRILKKHGVSA